MSGLFTHPWMSGLFGDEELQAVLSPESSLKAMIRVEEVYLLARGEAGATDPVLAAEAAAAISGVQIDIEALRESNAIDGLPVPGLVGQLKRILPARYAEVAHVGLTSQDVMDTGLVLQLREAVQLLDNRLEALEQALTEIQVQHGANPLMGRTRMQAALPVTVGDRVDTWRLPLTTHRQRLAELKPRLVCLQLGGPVGDGATFGNKYKEISEAMARRFDLAVPDRSWHVMRAPFAELASWLSLVTASLGKMGQDVSLMAQQGVDEIRLAGGGSSSAMPHKANPVQAELLVTLAQFNAVQVSGMHHAMLSEQERSGVAWALEMMILPGMLMACGCALKTARDIAQKIETIGDV